MTLGLRYIKLLVLVVSAACLAVGCGESDRSVDRSVDGGVDLAPRADLASLPDLVPGVPIGAPCVKTSQCGEGKAPVCWASLFNDKKLLATPDGYCSSACTTDADCGANAYCEGHDPTRACFHKCSADDCRDGYACFITFPNPLAPVPICVPSGNLVCDPTENDGTCQTQLGGAGGCERVAMGPGVRGECHTGCVLGEADPAARAVASSSIAPSTCGPALPAETCSRARSASTRRS